MASSIITNLQARTNGFSYIVQAKVRNTLKTYHMHLGKRYADEIFEIENESFNVFTRPVDDRDVKVRLREELILQMVGKRS